ncbi:hypothetical protein DXG03_006921 [Asterophora parasitica]|uniref:Uncharacterized protein n=1 Tax=Asterophora parasitica TaxID=117018 RepID=A0A9P7G6R9_9AGAR|nr:hypothetical protein DXG03_006921 [Asterophora parasitica]
MSAISSCSCTYSRYHVRHTTQHVFNRAYLVISTFCVTALGYKQLFEALGITYTPWPYHVPEFAYVITYLLSVVLFLAVGIMLSYHLYNIAWAETSVEAQDHDVYRKKAKSRAEVGNGGTYSFSSTSEKLDSMFHLHTPDPQSSFLPSPLYTLFVPFRINPYTDGRSWARREGYDRHQGVRRGEELTDEEYEDE